MTFPLYLDTYRVGNRCYRRMPYSGYSTQNVAVTNGDTEDLYGEEEEYEDGIECGGGKEYVSHGDQGYDMEEEDVTNDVPSTSVVTVSGVTVPPPPGFGPPPGFSKQPIRSKDVPVTTKKKECVPVVVEDIPFTQCEEDTRVEQSGKKWRAGVDVPSMFHSRLIGQMGRVLKEMEQATGCRVKIPGKGSKEERVVITSTVGLDNVQRCLDRIEIILIKAREGTRFTHFAAIPLIQDEMQESYRTFKDMVMTSDVISQSCKDDRLFVPPSKLHLTIAMLRIFSEGDKKIAEEALKKAGEKIRSLLNSAPLIIDVQGLQIMNDDPSQVDVLYATVTGEHVQIVSNIVRDYLVQSGLSSDNERGKGEDVKLHMTILNSRYLAEKLRKQRKRFTNARYYTCDGEPLNKRRRLTKNQSSKRVPFDAKTLMEQLGEFYFGTVIVKEIVLCSMNTEASSGFYQTSSTITLD